MNPAIAQAQRAMPLKWELSIGMKLESRQDYWRNRMVTVQL